MDSFNTASQKGTVAAGKGRGRILEIQRMSTEDGPGLRTTVFFKGCSLSCAWCHNPESISPRPELVWDPSGCIGCGLCRETCRREALESGGAGLVIRRDRCAGCGDCAGACPTRSLTLLGELWEAEDLIRELVKDRAYFAASGGGVTLSGGEAALQPDLAGPVLEGLKAAGIHTALDTCGMVSPGVLEGLLPHTDLLLFDIKEMDPDRHRAFTGAGNERILETLVRVAGMLEDTGTALWIRTPVIPGATDRRENIRGIAGFIREHLAGRVDRWELCAFNPLGKDKYARLGRIWTYGDCGLMSDERMTVLRDTALAAGMVPETVHVTGMMETREDQVEQEKQIKQEKQAEPAKQEESLG